MADIAPYYASLAGAPNGRENSKPLAKFVSERIALPWSLAGFTHCHTFNRKRRKRLRKICANKIAIDAARAGRALPDSGVIVVGAFTDKMGADKKSILDPDGMFVSTGRSGWGDDFPALMRNGNWQ